MGKCTRKVQWNEYLRAQPNEVFSTYYMAGHAVNKEQRNIVDYNHLSAHSLHVILYQA